MIAKQELWSLVLAGYWNRMIFTPEYVGQKFFSQDEVETVIALLPIFPIIYRHPKVNLEVSAVSLTFRPRQDADNSLNLSEEMALRALDELPSTPLIGAGMNFAFVEQNPRPDLVELFNVGDGARVGGGGWDARETKIIRKLQGEHGLLNLTLIYDGSNLEFHFNFHVETNVHADAKAAVAGRFKRMRDVAVAFIDDNYDLHLEKGEFDG